MVILGISKSCIAGQGKLHGLATHTVMLRTPSLEDLHNLFNEILSNFRTIALNFHFVLGLVT